MHHIAMEALARLVDEAPTAPESAHLEACGACRTELEGLRSLRGALRDLPDLPAPAAVWNGVDARLREEGLIGARAARSVRPARAEPAGRSWLRPLLRAAAALALVAAGAGANELWRGSPGAERAARPDGGAAVAGGVRVVANGSTALDEVAHEVAVYEAAYLEALTRYAELAGGRPQVDPLDRLAALESIVLTTRAALERSPADPVINGYHLASLSQRDALLRQLARQQGRTTGTPSVVTDDPWF
jgi:hypothetical protein